MLYIGRDKPILRVPVEPDSKQDADLNGPKEDDLISLARETLAQLEARGLTLAVGESLTGGLIGHALTETPGTSRVFLGSVVAYDNRLKERLGVTRETLNTYGAVSEQAAVEMAQGVGDWTGADIGLAVTGIAGPGAATDAKPVGLTFIAVADKTDIACERHHWGEDRSANKLRTAEAALSLLIRRLTETSA